MFSLKSTFAFCFCFLIIQNSFCQSTTAVDALALKIAQPASSSDIIKHIKQNFTTESDRIRAAYVWVTNNISYDIARLRAKDKEDADYKRQAVDDVIATKAAVCQGYADLFAEICNGSGVKAIVIGGYTKKDGVLSTLSHAWVGVRVNDKWFMFDPTWGAGYIRNDVFVRSFNEKFYMAQPAEFIKDHVPFDPIYQFLNYTVSNKEFIEGQTAPINTKSLFNFTDSLKQHEQLSPNEKLIAEMRRLEASGIRNDMLLTRLNYLKKNIHSYASRDVFNEAGAAYKQAITLYNQYIDHKRQQFSNIEDNQLKQIVDSIAYNIKASRSLLVTVVPKHDSQRDALSKTNQSLERFYNQFLKEKEFAERYLSTDKNSRRQLFVKH